MSEPTKKIKPNQDEVKLTLSEENAEKLYNKLITASKSLEQNQFTQILKKHQMKKHPILQVVQPTNDIYKTNPQKKKKPIQVYLDTVNQLYKKKDLDILINPIYPANVFQKWSPRQVAIFEQGIIKFGKQFQFIAELIKTKNPKDVFEFYNQWRFTSHFKQYKSYITSVNRSNLEDYI